MTVAFKMLKCTHITEESEVEKGIYTTSTEIGNITIYLSENREYIKELLIWDEVPPLERTIKFECNCKHCYDSGYILIPGPGGTYSEKPCMECDKWRMMINDGYIEK